MSAAHLVLAGVLAVTAAPDDPSALVERLGAPRYADREAATRALEALGRDALPALRAARRSEDPEVRARAAALLGRIEAASMVRPTLVRLDFRDRPIAEVVKTLSDRTGVPMVLVPENNPQWRSRRITLEEPEPVSFWGLLDRLGASGFQASMAMTSGPGGRGPVVQLYPGFPAGGVPTSDSGPFRATIYGIHYHRDRTFGGPGMPGLPFAQPARAPGGAAQASSVQFTIDLQVTAEPRMAISQNGPVKLVEALDEKGNNLIPATSSETVRQAATYLGGPAVPGLTSTQVQVPLRYPDEPGRVIKRLRGTLPVTVSARKDDPLVIDLSAAKGKTFQTEDATLTIHDVRAEMDQPRTSIELSLRPSSPSVAAGGAFGAELMAFRGPNFPLSQVEILDAQGRVYHQWFPASTRVDADALQMTLTLLHQEGLGPPVQLRFYDMVRAAADVAFEFHDVPMP